MQGRFFFMPLVPLVPKYNELSPFFPPLSTCQPWKIDWLRERMLNSSEHAVRTLDQYVFVFLISICHSMTKTGPVHIKTDSMMEVFGDALRVNLKLDTLDHHHVPADVIKAIDKIILKTNHVCVFSHSVFYFIVR